MVKLILLILFYLTFPLVIIQMCRKWSICKKAGCIVLAYGFGLLIGSVGIMPKGSEGYRNALKGNATLPKSEIEMLISQGQSEEGDYFTNQVRSIQDNLKNIVVLAFPLMLFSLNLKRWFRYASKGFISVLLALIAGPVMVTLGFLIFRHLIPEAWKLAGMFVGIYTGGTPNFVALSIGLEVDTNLFVMAVTYDTIVGAFLVLFFITIAPKIFRFILPPFKYKGNEKDTDLVAEETEDLEDFSGMFEKNKLLPLLLALGISILICAISVGVGTLLQKPLPNLPQNAVIILTITTLGILASFIKRLNIIEKTFQMGMYIILIFSLTVASMADLRTLFNIGMLNFILFITWVYFGSLILHLILAKIFRIDSDNFLITATAYIFSPPFVPLVANALKNKDVIITGITGGIIGYVLGNYIGFALAYFLKGL
jgi:uncharacterized membrane protein